MTRRVKLAGLATRKSLYFILGGGSNEVRQKGNPDLMTEKQEGGLTEREVPRAAPLIEKRGIDFGIAKGKSGVDEFPVTGPCPGGGKTSSSDGGFAKKRKGTQRQTGRGSGQRRSPLSWEDGIRQAGQSQKVPKNTFVNK